MDTGASRVYAMRANAIPSIRGSHGPSYHTYVLPVLWSPPRHLRRPDRDYAVLAGHGLRSGAHRLALAGALLRHRWTAAAAAWRLGRARGSRTPRYQP